MPHHTEQAEPQPETHLEEEEEEEEEVAEDMAAEFAKTVAVTCPEGSAYAFAFASSSVFFLFVSFSSSSLLPLAFPLPAFAPSCSCLFSLWLRQRGGLPAAAAVAAACLLAFSLLTRGLVATVLCRFGVGDIITVELGDTEVPHMSTDRVAVCMLVF
eukprot:COSAG06_NODE_3886_length_4803_cov_5.573342_4_plen_157_part_00